MTDKFDENRENTMDYAADKASRVKANAQNISQNIGNTLSDSIDDLKSYAHTAGQRLQHWLQNFSTRANTSKETLENRIRARPILATGTAFAVGMLATKLMAGRK
jgi:ElaB/YqjD/DUF883 family membrane-anchored ribosome-binding protein